MVFANSVLEARTDLYGEFIDVCAAITGRVPDAGLRRTENRRAEILFVVRDLPPALLADDSERGMDYPELTRSRDEARCSASMRPRYL